MKHAPSKDMHIRRRAVHELLRAGGSKLFVSDSREERAAAAEPSRPREDGVLGSCCNRGIDAERHENERTENLPITYEIKERRPARR